MSSGVHPACVGMNAEIRSKIFGVADGMNQSMQQTTFAVAPDFRVRSRKLKINMLILFASLFTFLFVCYLLWSRLFSPLYHLKDKMTVSIREAIIPDIQKTNNTIITLASASIVLTLSILQAFSVSTIKFGSYLITSWIEFAISVVLGIAVSILVFVFRAQYKVMIKAFEDYEKDKNDIEPGAERARELIKKLWLCGVCVWGHVWGQVFDRDKN